MWGARKQRAQATADQLTRHRDTQLVITSDTSRRVLAEVLLVDWQQRATLALFAYHRAANRCRTWHARVGGAAVILTAVIGTAVFATLQSELSFVPRLVVGAVSVLAAILAGIQTFAAFPQRIEDYEKAARRYSAVRRDIEAVRLSLPVGADEIKGEVARIRESLDRATADSPNGPRRSRTELGDTSRGNSHAGSSSRMGSAVYRLAKNSELTSRA